MPGKTALKFQDFSTVPQVQHYGNTQLNVYEHFFPKPKRHLVDFFEFSLNQVNMYLGSQGKDRVLD